MTDTQLCPTAEKVLAVLKENPGVHHTVEDVRELIDCTSTHTGCALEWLATAGLIERWESARRTVTYVARK